MKAYTLKEDEVVLYNGNVKIEKRGGRVELVLTNHNVFFITTIKKLFAKEQVEVEEYTLDQIKIYNEIPQVKQKDDRVEIFLKSGEKTVIFETMFEARKFVSAVMQVVTGKTTTARGAAKVKGAIGLVDDTLGIDTVGTIKTVLENKMTGGIVGSIGKTVIGKPNVKEMLNREKEVLEETQPEPTISKDIRIEAMKKYKEYLEAGIITQEEYDQKKKEILGI